MKFLPPIIGLLLVLSTPVAFGQSPGANPGPCNRGQTQIRMAGLDVDEMRCKMQIMLEQEIALSDRLASTEASRRLVVEDLKTARASLVEALDELGKFKGAVPSPSPEPEGEKK